MSYPNNLDTFIDPDSDSSMNDPSVLHSVQHSQLNRAVTWLETIVGIMSSLDPSCHECRINALRTQIDSITPLPLLDEYADAGNSGTTETILSTEAIPSSGSLGGLGTDGDKLLAEYGGTFIGSGTATRRIKVKFGTIGSEAVVFDTGALSIPSNSAWMLRVVLMRKSSSVVRYMISLSSQGSTPSVISSSGEVTGLDLTTSQNLIVTGTAASAGAASNDIVLQLGTISKVGRGVLNSSGMTGTGSPSIPPGTA